MNGPLVALVVLIAAGGVGAAAYVAMKPSTEELFVRECEAVLSDRLKAPATYVRVEASEQQRSPASLDEYLDIDSPAKMKIAMEARAGSAASQQAFDVLKEVYASADFETVSILLTYDASNAYGTPVRGKTICSQIVRKGDPTTTGTLSGTRIDGFDRVGWPIYQYWIARQ